MSAPRTLRCIAALLLALVPSVACAPAPTDDLAGLEPPGVHVDDARMGARVVAFPSDVASRVAVGEAELRVPASALDADLRARLVSRAVVVGDRGAGGGGGFLRTVSGVREEGEDVVLTTGPATWRDAFDTVALAVSRDATFDDGAKPLHALGLGGSGAGGLDVALRSRSLYDGEVPLAGGGEARVRVRVDGGSLRLTPSFDLEVAFPPGGEPAESDPYAYMGIDAGVDWSLAVHVDVDGPAAWPSGASASRTVRVDDVVAATWAQPFRFDAGGVPVSVRPRVRVGLACDVRASGDAHLSVRAQGRGSASAWAELLGDEWNAGNEGEPTFDAPQVTGTGAGTVHCRVVASVELHLWDAVGPTIALELGDEVGVAAGQASGAHRVDATLTRGPDAVLGAVFPEVAIARDAWPFGAPVGAGDASAPYVTGFLRSSGELGGDWAWRAGEARDCKLGRSDALHVLLRNLDDTGHQARLEVHADGTVRWERFTAKASRVVLDAKTASLRVELAPGTVATDGTHSVTLEGALVTGPCAP